MYNYLILESLQGIKPAALSKIKDSDLKSFIDKCLLPASLRLSAKKLLMDPFLEVNGSVKNRPLALRDIDMPKMTAFGDRCLMSEGPVTLRNKPPSMDKDHDPDMPIITSTSNSVNGSSTSSGVEVRRAKRDNVFLLKGEENDENSVSLILRIADQNGKFTSIAYSFLFS